MDPATCTRTASHNQADRIAIASLSGAVQRLAYPLYREDPSYNEAAAVAELHTFSTNPHLLAHATSSANDFLHHATRALLLAAGADQGDLDQIAERIAANSPMPR